MARRLLIYGTLVLAVVGFALVQRHFSAREDARFAAAVPPIADAVAHRHFDGAHLPPDRRFLAAVAIAHRLVRGGAPDTARARFADGRWEVSYEARPVAALSEFPAFAEEQSALTAWCVALGARDSFAPRAPLSPPAQREIERELAALHALPAADRADRAWGKGARDARTAALGARSLLWLSAECLDAVGAGDPLLARAWAWTAMASALDSTALARETVLLAATLGYPADAWNAAEALPAGDPIRLYARRDDARLGAAAAARPANCEARWLAVLRCVERHDLEGWTVAASRGLDRDTALALPLLGSELALGRFETNLGAANLVMRAVAADLDLDHAGDRVPDVAGEGEVGRTMRVFEHQLDTSPRAADGAFLDRDVVAAWYRAAFYSSLFRIGEHLRNELSDLKGTLDFAKQMGDGTGIGGPAGEFQRWYWDLAVLKRGRTPGGALKGDLVRPQSFGGLLANVTFTAIRENDDAGSPYLRRCARFLEGQLDARPEQLAIWGDVLTNDLGNVLDGESVRAAAARASHPLDFRTRAAWAVHTGDHAAIDSMVAAPVDDPFPTIVALESLRRGWPGDSLRIDAAYDRLIADHPDDWYVVGQDAHALLARHRDARVRELLAAWLHRPRRSARAFDEIDARTTLARACLSSGLAREGYAAIEPALASGQGGAMATGAELLDRIGRGADAETLAVMAWERYPDNPAAEALVADLLWRHGRYEEAAYMLAHAPQRMIATDWRQTLGPRFAAFEREHPAEARQAFAAMAAARLDDWERMGSLIAALADAGRHASAAELFPRVRTASGGDDQNALVRLLLVYRNVKAARGAAAAAEWLNANLPDHREPTIAYLHLFAYGARDDEMQWVLPIVGDADGAENLWLMRAAAMVRDSAGTPAQRAAVRAHFARPGDSRYRHFARLLLGLESPGQILALRGEGKAPGEAFYYLALARQAAGDYRGAAEWYERCVDQNVWLNGEHHWALAQLAAWAARDRSLDRLAAEDGWPRASQPASQPAAALAPTARAAHGTAATPATRSGT